LLVSPPPLLVSSPPAPLEDPAAELLLALEVVAALQVPTSFTP
jgi:hypothetical protein